MTFLPDIHGRGAKDDGQISVVISQAFKLLLAAELIFETKRNLTSNKFEQ